MSEKRELSNLFYVLNKMGIGDLTANHASILSQNKKGYYINKHKYLFSQVNQNNLVFVSLKDNYSTKYKHVNKAGFHIHKYLHNSIAKPKAILHTHTVNGIAISCLKNGFNTKLNQSSMRFHNKIEYFKYNGMVVDDKEGIKLKKIIKKDTKLIILRNHGIILIGESIDEIFHLNYHFEKCAEVQLLLGNKVLNHSNNKLAKLTSLQHGSFGKIGSMSWSAIKKQLNL